MITLTRYSFAIITTLFAFSLWSIPSFAAETTVTVELNWFPEVDDGGIYEALAEGLYKKVGLNVKVISGGEKPHGQIELAARRYDFYTGGEMGILRAIKAGLPVEAVGCMLQMPLTAIITHTNVHSLINLKGHPILVSENGRSSYWPWLQKKYHFSKSQRQPYLGSIAPFLEDNNIAQQGYITYEPFIINEHKVNCNVFLLSKIGLPGQGELIETNSNYAMKHPEVVKRFLLATIEGYKNYLSNPKLGNLLIFKANPSVGISTLEYGYSVLKKGCFITGNKCRIQDIGQLNQSSWRQTYAFMVKWKLLPSGVNYMSGYNSSYLPKAVQ
ncbi:ABC transporter substrate-binding protein [Acidithiobacillus ferrianus]|uniref:ABC transporter substrate-binding protein n=1 Tax=Acidithiobacillus ferrianus TaxID=2678518 RepID=UPI0034E3C09B